MRDGCDASAAGWFIINVAACRLLTALMQITSRRGRRWTPESCR
jgi:hypothetical protein